MVNRQPDGEFLFEVDDDEDDIGLFQDDIDLDADDMIDFELAREHQNHNKRDFFPEEDDDNDEMTLEGHLAMLDKDDEDQSYHGEMDFREKL